MVKFKPFKIQKRVEKFEKKFKKKICINFLPKDPTNPQKSSFQHKPKKNRKFFTASLYMNFQITACSITTRMRNGETRSISAGCKAKDACESDKLNNFAIFEEQSATSGHQCRPDAQTGPSVCRQCCYSNNCNFMLDFVDELGWSQVLF